MEADMKALNAAIGAAVIGLAVSADLYAASQSQPPAPGALPEAQPSPQNGARTWAPLKPFDGQIVRQAEHTVLSSILAGLTVYAPDGKTIGNINNLIVKSDGGVEGVVIGFGNFLGIVERRVAVKWEKIHFVPMEDGGAQVVLTASKEDLQDAPVFRSKADQEMERRYEEQRRRWIEEEHRPSRYQGNGSARQSRPHPPGS
jgi:hypothetical protein